MTRLLTFILSLTMGVVTCRGTFGQMAEYTVSELSTGGVPCRLNNLGDVAGRAVTLSQERLELRSGTTSAYAQRH
jgi:hypothetical protein